MTEIPQGALREMKRRVEALGVNGLSPEQIAQMAELEQRAHLTGLALRRVPSKQDEPAFLFPKQDLQTHEQGRAQ